MDIKNRVLVREYLREYDVLERFMEFIETGGGGVSSDIEEIRIVGFNNNGHCSQTLKIPKDGNTSFYDGILECVRDEITKIEKEVEKL